MGCRCKRIVGIAALAILAASLAANVVLWRQAVQRYREVQEVRLEPDSGSRFAAAVPAPAAGVPRIVLFGDSRVAEWTSFPAPVGVEVLNRGNGGDTSAQLLLRVQRDAIDLSPTVVVVQGGINDLKALGVLPSERHRGVIAACSANLAALVARLRSAGARVLLTTVIPPGPVEWSRRPLWSDATRAAVVEVNQALRALAGAGVTVLDCDSALGDARRLADANARDALHLNAAGYARLDSLAGPALAAVVNGP